MKPHQIWQLGALAITTGLIGIYISALRGHMRGQILVQVSQPSVVASNSVLCDLAQQIARDTINLKCLIDAGSDPHEYQPRPEDRRAIEQAKLILYGGYNVEPAVVKMIKATSHPAPNVAVDEVAVPKPQKFDDEGERVTDPHVWHNAQNGVAIASVISRKLTQLEPGKASFYAANTQTIATELTQLHPWIKSQIATIPATQRKLVTTHDALGYYSTAYGIPIVGALQGISTEEKPTPQRIAELVKAIRATGVPTIFAEVTVNPKLIESVARDANVNVSDRDLYADGIGAVGTDGDTYQKMLIANTKTIVEGLGGKYTPPRLDAKP
jgi:manganese/iron transport system substrate-binding protein